MWIYNGVGWPLRHACMINALKMLFSGAVAAQMCGIMEYLMRRNLDRCRKKGNKGQQKRRDDKLVLFEILICCLLSNRC